MVAQLAESQQPLDVVRALHVSLDALTSGCWDAVSDVDLRRAMTELSRVEARAASQRMQIARQLERSGAAKRVGAPSTGALLARDFGGDTGAGHGLVRAAENLENATRTEEALSAGAITFGQARVIGEGLARLPESVTEEQRGLAERSLLADAGRLTLKDLRRRADRAADAFAQPEVVDGIENELLQDRERRARANSHFSMWDRHDGTHEGTFRLPSAEAEMLKTALDGFAAPRREHLHEAAGAPEEPIEQQTRMGHAFMELCARLPKDKLPDAGGMAATVVVTLPYDTLMGELRAATLSTGTRISAGQARLMACEAGLIPAVLGGKSEILDLGREKRDHNLAQRIAITVRDGGCTVPGCDRPPGWCVIHHPRYWSRGGRTDLTGVMICPAHHRIVHDEEWQVRHHDGHVEYQRPGDPVWRRNHRWRP